MSIDDSPKEKSKNDASGGASHKDSGIPSGQQAGGKTPTPVTLSQKVSSAEQPKSDASGGASHKDSGIPSGQQAGTKTFNPATPGQKLALSILLWIFTVGTVIA
jgi:hypothetical protein